MCKRMAVINLEINEIPHGHGLSFKRGVASSLVDIDDLSKNLPSTHEHSFERGKQIGNQLKTEIAKAVKD